MRGSAAIVAAIGALLIGSAHASAQRAPARPGAMLNLTATAYCHAGKTQSGTTTKTGIVAADPIVLPVGSVVQLDTPKQYAGIYTVMDTGSAIKGRILDIFIPDCGRALEFGKQLIHIRVLRRGWNPKASAAASVAR
jgi:3D (Asp-Asp-Asp) domain-containing protein